MGIAVSVNIEDQSRLQKRRNRELKKVQFDVQNIGDLLEKAMSYLFTNKINNIPDSAFEDNLENVRLQIQYDSSIEKFDDTIGEIT